MFGLSFRLGLGLLFMSLQGLYLGGHFMTFTCPYYSPEVMVKFTRRATGHFVTLFQNGMHLIRCIYGHICSL